MFGRSIVYLAVAVSCTFPTACRRANTPARSESSDTQRKEQLQTERKRQRELEKKKYAEAIRKVLAQVEVIGTRAKNNISVFDKLLGNPSIAEGLVDQLSEIIISACPEDFQQAFIGFTYECRRFANTLKTVTGLTGRLSISQGLRYQQGERNR
jgi:hypothetical protein